MRRVRFTGGVVFSSGTAKAQGSRRSHQPLLHSPALIREGTTSLSAMDLYFLRGSKEKTGDEMLKLILFIGHFGVGNIRSLWVLNRGLGAIGEGTVPFTDWAPRLDTGVEFRIGYTSIYLAFVFKDGTVGGALMEKDADSEKGHLFNAAVDCVLRGNGHDAWRVVPEGPALVVTCFN